jgi:hypothetical protein
MLNESISCEDRENITVTWPEVLVFPEYLDFVILLTGVIGMVQGSAFQPNLMEKDVPLLFYSFLIELK